MAISDADLWHQIHAEREDGVATMFLVRDIEPRPDQPRIFVIELPYPITDLSKLPDAASSRRLDTFQEQWVEPACEALGWTFVASKSEDGSFFLYLYGDGDPDALLEKLAPFDGELGFFSDVDADWSEYAALRELVDQAEAADETHEHSASCEHGDDEDDGGDDDDDDGDGDDGGDEVSDGVPAVIPVIDLTDDAPARRARATTLNLGKPLADPPTHPKAARAAPRAAARSAPARKAAKPTRGKPAAKPAGKPAAKAAKPAAKAAKPSRAKPAAKPAGKPAAQAAKPSRAKPAAKPAGKPAAQAAKPSRTRPAAKAAKPSRAKPAAKPARSAAKPARAKATSKPASRSRR